MFTIEKAVILAAGMGNRLKPVTNEIPKPLVQVNGKRMLDSVIDALHENGIKEIYVVVGYRKEMFTVINKKYPEITFIDNPWFSESNNISSLYCARDHLENAFILDGDQIIYNSKILQKEAERSGYNAVWTEKPTNEWLLSVKKNIITSCSRIGGNKGWQLYSVSRWSAEDGKKLKNHLEIEFENGNWQIFWDDIALFCYPKEYSLGITKMNKEDIVEIDNLEELIKADPSYLRWREKL